MERDSDIMEVGQYSVDVEKNQKTRNFKSCIRGSRQLSDLFIGKGKVLGYRKAREGVGGAEGKHAACRVKSGSARK